MKSILASAAAAAAAATAVMLVGCGQSPSASSAPQPAVSVRQSSEKVLFESEHIRYVEVTNWPGDNLMGAVPFPSVVMADAAWPELVETPLDPALAQQESVSASVIPVDQRPYPWCRTQSPMSARTVTVKGDFPQHYYRVDYKRLDGKDYGSTYLQRHADVFGPPTRTAPDPGTSLRGGKPMSQAWPYDAGYSAVTAAPANHNVRFQDDHIEVIEVAIRDGETENMHGHPYSSVFADDGGARPDGAVYRNDTLLPNRAPPFGPTSAPPRGNEFPLCWAAIEESPHAVTVEKGPAQHFYRIHFKRVDGDAVKTQWQGWYPQS